jgi:hypothetical protein
MYYIRINNTRLTNVHCSLATWTTKEFEFYVQEWTRRLGQLQRQTELVNGTENGKSKSEPFHESIGSHTVSAVGQHSSVWDEQSTATAPVNVGSVDGNNLTDIGSEQSGDSVSTSDAEVRIPQSHDI